LHVFFQQLKDRYADLQKSQQVTAKEQTDLARQLDDIKARKVKNTYKKLNCNLFFLFF